MAKNRSTRDANTPPVETDDNSLRSQISDDGLSLDKLSDAFAAMLHAGEDPYVPVADAEADPLLAAANQLDEADLSVDESDESNAEAANRRTVDDNCEISPASILEAILFVGSPNNQPLTSELIAAQMRGVRAVEIEILVTELNATYQERNCPYRIVPQGAGYRMQLLDTLSAVRERFHGRPRPARLSPAAIEVLAAVAYNETLTAEEINRLRGTESGAILTQLVRRQLLRVERHDDAPRVLHYYTTPRFLALFGIDGLQELPRSQELER
ncbi:MAG: SMC-Scp complex subunit ScpB [Planctomycetota bacterium]|nr:SMC-Scp complex subunit ScpB [Planctomycetota bacterium]